MCVEQTIRCKGVGKKKCNLEAQQHGILAKEQNVEFVFR